MPLLAAVPVELQPIARVSVAAAASARSELRCVFMERILQRFLRLLWFRLPSFPFRNISKNEPGFLLAERPLQVVVEPGVPVAVVVPFAPVVPLVDVVPLVPVEPLPEALPVAVVSGPVAPAVVTGAPPPVSVAVVAVVLVVLVVLASVSVEPTDSWCPRPHATAPVTSAVRER
jgi:hypothetical protein